MELASYPVGGACAGMDPNVFHDEGRETEAKAVCARCSVAEACLAWARAHPHETRLAIYGGLTPRERGLRRDLRVRAVSEKRCKNCRRPFTPHHGRVEFCSLDCKRLAAAARREERKSA